MKTTSVIVAGVGGQGSILAAHILGKAAMRLSTESGEPARVCIGETYGAAMRGGKVFSHVRVGDARASLTTEDGADLIIGLEPLETLRVAIPYLSPEGVCIVNTARSIPADVKMGRAHYPEVGSVLEALRRLGRSVIAFDATAVARELGSTAVMNSVMLGAATVTGVLPLGDRELRESLADEVPPQTVESNLRAFDKGRQIALSLQQEGGFQRKEVSSPKSPSQL